MKKNEKKIQLRSDAIVVLNPAKMSKIIGKGLGDVCEVEGVLYYPGENFRYENNWCVCLKGPAIKCTVIATPPVEEGCWCTCRCQEAAVMGFQIGMITPQNQGSL